MTTYKFEDLLKQKGVKPEEVVSFGTPEQTDVDSFISAETRGDIKQAGSEIVTAYKDRQANARESIQAYKSGEQGILSTFGQAVGEGSGLITDVVAATTKGLVKLFTGQEKETAISRDIQGISEGIAQIPAVQSMIKWYGQLDPETQRNLRAVGNFASLVIDMASGTGASTIAKRTGKEVLDVAGQVATKTGEVLKGGVGAVKDAISGIRNVVGMIGEEAKTLPGRISTNLAEKQAIRQTVKELPTEIAQEAARNGIEVPDVKYLYNIPKEQKSGLKRLLQTVQDFDAGKTKVNPIEVVGKPIVNRIKQLETSLGTVGQKLGAVADNLGEVTTKETFPSIFSKLKEVSGLKGLEVSKKGVLDFTNTTLATLSTKADRQAIQRIFTDAIKAGTGKQKHLLRQELFEILGGKKKALVNLTDTQEKAYQAIRQGLSDILETKNASYKTLSNEYRKIVQPLSDIRKFMKTVVGADEDILDMSAGLLARRLTSNAASNPQIRMILRAMDSATKTKGKTLLNIENLQDFYNVLDKYYNIAGKTSLQGQVTAGVEKATGVMDLVSSQIRGLAGQTDAVKKAALKKIFEEALK